MDRKTVCKEAFLHALAHYGQLFLCQHGIWADDAGGRFWLGLVTAYQSDCVYRCVSVRTGDFPKQMDAGAGKNKLIAVAVCAGLHLWKKNTLLSIIGSTAVYMILVVVCP